MLSALAETKSNKKRNSLIKNCDKAVIQAISEICLNVLNGNISINTECKAKLKRHKQKLRLMRKKNISVVKKRKILQTGGFLGALLVPIISSLASALLSKALS